MIFSFAAYSQTKEKNPLSIRPYLSLGSSITLNTASQKESAPTPVQFTGGGGAVINFSSLISLEPRLDFWAMYYLYDGKNALPAEMEQRTATVLCFMLDVPVGFNFHVKDNTFTIGAGLGFLMRFAFLSSGIKGSEPGATGSASSDASHIMSWCWSNARFLYPEIFLSWDYKIFETMRVGICTRFYFPIGSVISGRALDGMLFNVAARIVF